MSLEITRSLSAARKQYAASCRETAKHVLAANLVHVLCLAAALRILIYALFLKLI